MLSQDSNNIKIKRNSLEKVKIQGKIGLISDVKISHIYKIS